MVETDEELHGKPVFKIETGDRFRKVVKQGCELDECGTVFLARKSKRKQGKQRFCSVSCSTKQQMRDRSHKGENNPNWKGGISEDHYHYKKIQVKRYPKRVKAREKLNQKIRSGKIEREPCKVCGSEEDLQAHHEDYSKPLDVEWYCRKHHREIHEDE